MKTKARGKNKQVNKSFKNRRAKTAAKSQDWFARLRNGAASEFGKDLYRWVKEYGGWVFAFLSNNDGEGSSEGDSAIAAEQYLEI